MKLKSFLLGSIAICSLFTSVSPLLAQGAAFTYQGQLQNNGNLVNGNYDLRLQLWNDSTGGSVIGGPVTNTMVAVSNGLFTTIIDFGAGVFTGSSNWLHIGVRTNGSGTFTGLLPRQQLTPTPYAIFAESANAAGLTGTIPPGDLTGVSGIGLTGVALLAGGNAFTGNQFITGLLKTGNGSGVGSHTDMVIGPGGYFSGEEHRIDFNDGNSPIGSLILGYNGNGYFSFGNLYQGFYRSGTKAFTVFGNGNVNVDPDNLNAGFINSGNTNSSGLTFGSGSGEGIASKRTAGGNLYGLDFYTGFVDRMSILNNGNMRINGNTLLLEPASAGVYVNDGLVWGNGGLAGSIASSASAPFLAGYYGGSLGALNPNIVALSWDASGNVAVNKQLTVQGEFAVVNGLGNEQAYMGGDGAGSDVQFGSLNPAIMNVAFYNAANNAPMHIFCSSITIQGGADLAEPFTITSGNNDVPQGAVVVIDEQNPGHLKVSDQPYDTRVAGVVSGANGINPGIQMQQQGLLEGGKNVALTGRVYVQADVSNGTIKPGDLLTTSTTPGYAMKVTDHTKAQGAILGKAMTGLNGDKGMVLVLVTLQ
jgi:hypothetical protein